MSEDSGWTEPDYDFSGADSSDFTEVPDYLTAAHPLDTAPVIETADRSGMGRDHGDRERHL